MDSPSPPEDASRPNTLIDLRTEIDRIDDAMLALLMQRADVVERVGRLGKTSYRPGREADVIRRLLRRHAGPLPARALCRLWREIFAANIAIETEFAISVCDTSHDGAYAAAAREHFGALTPLRVHRSPAQAIAEVSARTVTAAVLPMPVEEEAAPMAWWVPLLHRDEPRIHVVAKLPFWARPRGDGAVSVQALVVAAAAPDPSGQDRTLLGFEVAAEMSRASLATALGAAGIVPGAMLLRRDPAGGAAHALIDLDGYLRDDDARLATLARVAQRPVVLGCYAVPVQGPP